MLKTKLEESKHISARISLREAEEIERLVKMGFFMNESDFARTAIREKIASLEIHAVRETSVGQTKKEIINYLRKHPVAYPSDIALELGLDLSTVMKAVRELWEARKIEEANKK